MSGGIMSVSRIYYGEMYTGSVQQGNIQGAYDQGICSDLSSN